MKKVPSAETSKPAEYEGFAIRISTYPASKYGVPITDIPKFCAVQILRC